MYIDEIVREGSQAEARLSLFLPEAKTETGEETDQRRESRFSDINGLLEDTERVIIMGCVTSISLVQ